MLRRYRRLTVDEKRRLFGFGKQISWRLSPLFSGGGAALAGTIAMANHVQPGIPELGVQDALQPTKCVGSVHEDEPKLGPPAASRNESSVLAPQERVQGTCSGLRVRPRP